MNAEQPCFMHAWELNYSVQLECLFLSSGIEMYQETTFEYIEQKSVLKDMERN